MTEKLSAEEFMRNYAAVKERLLRALESSGRSEKDVTLLFRNMYKLFLDIRDKNIDNSSMSVLSMGMSGDLDVAVAEGATLVRVGSALFGKRIYNRT